MGGGYGLPGDGVNGIIESLRTRKDKIRFIQVRLEEAAAFNACGYAALRRFFLKVFIPSSMSFRALSGLASCVARNLRSRSLL